MKHINLIIATILGILALLLISTKLQGISLLLLLSAILFVIREKRVDPEK